MLDEKEGRRPSSKNLTLIVRIGSIIAFLFAMLFIVDSMLPHQMAKDVLVQKLAMHSVTRRNRSDEVRFRTRNFSFEVDMSLFNSFTEGDTIELHYTPVFKQISKVKYFDSGKNATYRARLLGGWSRVLLALFIGYSTLIGLSKKYDPSILMRAGIAATVGGIVLCVIIFFDL